jgi:hypothetical protein
MTTHEEARSYATAAVRRGAALLDARVPGWVAKIDLNELDMFSGSHCILGQLFRRDHRDDAGYATGRDHLFAGQTYDQMHRQAVEFGFNFTGDGAEPPRTTVNALDEAWESLIVARRTATFAPVEPMRTGQQFLVSWHGGDEPSFFLTDSAAEGYGKFAEWLGQAELNDCLSILTIFEGVIMETVTRFAE